MDRSQRSPEISDLAALSGHPNGRKTSTAVCNHKLRLGASARRRCSNDHDSYGPDGARFNCIIAFEVSKAELAVFAKPQNVSSSLANTKAAVTGYLKKQIGGLRRADAVLAVCEATGGYERFVLEAAGELGLACHRAHGSRVRAYARYRGTHATTDAIDVRLLADYGNDDKAKARIDLEKTNQTAVRSEAAIQSRTHPGARRRKVTWLVML